MLKKISSVRFVLLIGLLVSIAFASYSIYYKINNWGFRFTPKQMTDVWTIEAHVTFTPIPGETQIVSIARPSASNEFKILDEDVVAPDYKIKKGTERIELSSLGKTVPQNIYYRVLVYDNTDAKGKVRAPKPPAPQKPALNEQSMLIASQILQTAATRQGDEVQQIIYLLNMNPPDPTVQAFVPAKKSPKETAQMIMDLLALKDIPARTARGIKLAENKKSFTPDVMVEAYLRDSWRLYNIETGAKGLPDDFVIFQRGGNSLVDVIGGTDSVTKYSVLKSISTSFSMAKHRAKALKQTELFDYSIYNLPLNEQNALKWLMIFPLAIFVVVLMRNVIGLKTMGTFTPMLIAMALVETGLIPGLISFTFIVGLGVIIRSFLSKLNLLLVPRISAVVIFVILIIQAFTIIGYHFKWNIASSALFFPIIIMAWIIERASITWEEEGMKNAAKEVFNSVFVAIITYFIIVDPYIRHIMFAFNELNLVILFIVMLLGTYTGYRLNELIRFAPLSQKEKER